jgi:hypothetical protein
MPTFTTASSKKVWQYKLSGGINNDKPLFCVEESLHTTLISLSTILSGSIKRKKVMKELIKVVRVLCSIHFPQQQPFSFSGLSFSDSSGFFSPKMMS